MVNCGQIKTEQLDAFVITIYRLEPKGFEFSGLKRTNLMALKMELPISYKEKLRPTGSQVMTCHQLRKLISGGDC